ncbi:hypothetical protein [Zavarzinia aquatilis]|nr:hypothetical protein [Zavarzinia aquatilis]
MPRPQRKPDQPPPRRLDLRRLRLVMIVLFTVAVLARIGVDIANGNW